MLGVPKDPDSSPESPNIAEGVTPAPVAEERLGLLSAGSALFAAILSSACCWLPLVMIGAGSSAIGVATFFEAYRVHFLVGATALLGVGFYTIYFRKPGCSPGDACAVPNPKLQKLNRAMLWVATVFILLFATFPEYVTLLIQDPEPEFVTSAEPAAPAKAQTIEHSYSIEGMTCEGCTVHAKKALSALPGVQHVKVSYSTKEAQVSMTQEVPLNKLSLALGEFGYRITAVDGVAVAP